MRARSPAVGSTRLTTGAETAQTARVRAAEQVGSDAIGGVGLLVLVLGLANA